MTIICDPTLLQTKRGLEWLDRAVARDVAHHLCTSRAFIDGRDQTRWSTGFFSRRQLSPSWNVADTPVALVDFRDLGMDLVTTRLVKHGLLAVADVWSGLREGQLLAARRPRVIDELVTSGVALHVTDDEAPDAITLFPDLPRGIAEALTRRVRFYCRVSVSPEQEGTLRVVDLGWGKRR